MVAELRLATVVRATYSRRQVLEQMVDLWWNHFNIWPGESMFVAGLLPAADREHVRPHALGRFADLLQTSASNPAMLLYLDNYWNRAEAPNENYGRELLELHTVGVDAGFTERDVRDASRVFTGWSVDLRAGRMRFVPDWHDPGSKQVLDWSYLTNRTAVVPVLRHVVTSDAFRSSGGAKVRRPLDFFVAALRGVDADIGDPIGPSTAAGRSINWALLRLGHRPFDASSPAGYPETAGHWLGGGLLSHWSIAHELPPAVRPGRRRVRLGPRSCTAARVRHGTRRRGRHAGPRHPPRWTRRHEPARPGG